VNEWVVVVYKVCVGVCWCIGLVKVLYLDLGRLFLIVFWLI